MSKRDFLSRSLVNKSNLNILRFAAGIAAKRKNRQQSFYVGAFALRSDGVIVTAYNGCAMHPIPNGHAEARLTKKLDKNVSTIYVARYSFGSRSLALSKPCKNCQTILRNFGIKKAIYSISDSEFGVLEL